MASALQEKGHTISADTVRTLLRDAGYGLQSNRKVIEGTKDHPDRDEQFQWIADQTAAFQAARTTTRLKVQAELDTIAYPTGPDRRSQRNLNWVPEKFHGDWNYVIAPQP